MGHLALLGAGLSGVAAGGAALTVEPTDDGAIITNLPPLTAFTQVDETADGAVLTEE